MISSEKTSHQPPLGSPGTLLLIFLCLLVINAANIGSITDFILFILLAFTLFAVVFRSEWGGTLGMIIGLFGIILAIIDSDQDVGNFIGNLMISGIIFWAGLKDAEFLTTIKKDTRNNSS